MSPKGTLLTAETIGNLTPIERIAKRTEYSAACLRQLDRSGRIEGFKFNRDWLATPEAILKYLKRQRTCYENKLGELDEAERSLL